VTQQEKVSISQRLNNSSYDLNAPCLKKVVLNLLQLLTNFENSFTAGNKNKLSTK